MTDQIRALAHKWRHEAVKHENTAHEIYCDENYQETEESQLHRETAAALRQCSRELLEILDPEPTF